MVGSTLDRPESSMKVVNQVLKLYKTLLNNKGGGVCGGGGVYWDWDPEEDIVANIFSIN